MRFDCSAPLVVRGPSALVHACCIDRWYTLLGMPRNNVAPLSPSLNGGCFTSPLRRPSLARGSVWSGWLILTPNLVPHSWDVTSCREAAPSSSCSTDALVDCAVLPAPTFTLVSGAARRQCRLSVEPSSSTKPPRVQAEQKRYRGELPDGTGSL
jgi:hypothetical protein